MLCETTVQLQQTDFTDAEQAMDAEEAVKTVITLFESHAHKEDSFVFPAIAAYDPSVVDAFEQEHAEDRALGQSLQAWLTALHYAVAPSAKKTIGEDLTKAFIQFAIFNLRHMAKEEQVISPLLWRYYTDAELHGITLQIMKTIQPREMQLFSKWMMKGVNNAEALYWLQGVKNTAPQPAFEALLSVAEAELHPHRWNVIRESLTDGAMVA
jgi:hemerythrin-like domain-containing protein